jgi:transposase
LFFRKEEEKPSEEQRKALELQKRRERLMQWKASNKLQLKSLLEAFGSEEEPKKKGMLLCSFFKSLFNFSC